MVIRVIRPLLVAAAVVAVLGIAGLMERLFFVPDGGPTPAPPGAEAVDFVSGDGTMLHGWFLPAVGDGPARGTILHTHGNAGNIASHLGFTGYLPAAGFNLFIFDYRGYGQSAGRPTRRGSLIMDTHAALDTLLARPDVDADRIGLYAQSLGGAIGLAVMADRPEIRAAAIDSAFCDWQAVAAEAVGGDDPGLFARALAAILIRRGDPPLEAARRIDRPLLVLHGTDDTIVRAHHGRDIAEAAPRGALVLLDGGQHNSLLETHPEVAGLVVEFFEEQLGGAERRGRE